MWVPIIVSLLIIGLYLLITWNNDYWSKRNVPHAEPQFFFGNLRDVFLGKIHFGLNYVNLYRKFKDLPYFGYYKMVEPGIIINDPDLIKNVLIKDFAHFADNDFQVDPDVDKIWGSNVFGQSGELWKKNRSAWTYSMTTSKIKAMYESINEKCDIMINHVKDCIKQKPNEPLEVRMMASQFFTDVIVECMLGLKVNSFNNKDNAFIKIAQETFSATAWQGFVTVVFLIAPWLGKIFKFRFVPKKVEKQLLELSKQILEDRKVKGYQKQNPFDSIILNGGYEDSLNEYVVAGLLFGFLIDGTETSSGVSGYALYELSQNPECQEKLREELDKAAEANGGKLTYEDIHSLPYLDMIISETMRMHPPSMAVQRLCTKEYDLPPLKGEKEPTKIPVGMAVILPTYGLHLNPEYHPNPDKFDPERFNEDRKNDIPKFTYLPFGEGPRICLGVRLAMNQVKIGLAAIIRNFVLKPHELPKGGMDIDPNIFVMRPKGGLWAKFENRPSK